MVKADVKHNYYADLELPTSSSLEDVRKSYRKLALLYHPDRNSGKEEECVPKFQAIQTANEVLGDPLSKQKYDTDRRKAGFFPLGQTFNPRQPAPGNPYAANSAYPPPPRRTQPGAWQPRPPAPPGPGAAPWPSPSGADRFSTFPKSAPTARKDPAQDRTNMFRAWQNMNTAHERARNFVPPQAGPQPAPQWTSQQPQPQPASQWTPQPPQPQPSRQRPQPPPRQETKLPTEEQIRAGTKYRNGPHPQPVDPEKGQSAWSAFQQANAGKPGMTPKPSARTPRRQGFNPNMPGSDEKPADSHYSHRNQSTDLGRGMPSVRVPPPPPGPPPPGTNPNTPTSPLSPRTQRPHPDPTRPFSSRLPNDQVPFAEGHRDRTPYTSFLRERTDIGDGLRRSYSTRDTTTLGTDYPPTSRARSSSPMSRQRASEGNAEETNQKKPNFDVGFSSSESSDSNVDDMDHSRPGTAPNTRSPFDRPKEVPTPPSSRQNGARSGPNSSPPAQETNGTTNSARTDTEQPRNKTNMYADPSSFLSSFSSKFSTTSTPRSSSTSRARRTWLRVGRWAIPSSVNPSPGAKSFVTAADETFKNATKDEQSAYLRFQFELEKHYDYIPDNFDMEVFLKLASTARRGCPCGDINIDRILSCVLRDFSTVGCTDTNNKADVNLRDNSFEFPKDDDLFRDTNAKSGSEENINTKFSPNGWSGEFTGEPDYFAPPRSTGKRTSPSRRQNAGSNRAQREPSRSATTDVPTSSSAPQDEIPYRPWGSDGTPKEGPFSTAPGGSQFSKEEWEKTFKDSSWTWPPPPPRMTSPIKNGATGQRKQSQGRRTSRAGNRNVASSKQEPQHASLDDDDTAEVQDADGTTQSGVPVEDNVDPMDIDNTPPGQQDGATTHNTQQEKEARLYSVPKSRWRHEQEQRQNHAHGHSNKPGARSRMGIRSSLDDGAKMNTNLEDLLNVEPIAKDADGSGLQSLGHMSGSLPFPSQAESKMVAPQKLNMPQVPKAPSEPTKLTKLSWHTYAHSFGDYVKAFHDDFNSLLLNHFTAREQLAELRFKQNTNWLEIMGDTFGGQDGFGSYLTAVKQDEQVREHWNVGCEKHADAVKAFEKVRERVKKLATAGALTEGNNMAEDMFR